MKKLFTLVIIALFAAPFAIAQGVGSIDTECQGNGFDFGIVKFEWGCEEPGPTGLTIAGNCGYVPENPPIPPYIVGVEGDAAQANWTASPEVDGVLVKGGTEYDTYPGGASGTVSCVTYTNPGGQTNCHGISHITFCGDNETETTTTVPEITTTIPDTPAPEFASLVLPAIILLLAPGIAFIARKKE
ncbi:MAG: hypothetical protein ABH950_09335 [Candidatus Altiarchaeota archaeon]